MSLGWVYDHDVEGGFFLSLFNHDLAESVILDCPIDENWCVKANDRICDGRAEVGDGGQLFSWKLFS